MKSSAMPPARVPVGIVGLGLMGASIAACLLTAGHPVVGVEIDPTARSKARRRVRKALGGLQREGLLQTRGAPPLDRFRASGDYSELAGCELGIECIFEDVRAKRQVLSKIEEVVSPRALIGSNTSSIPVTQLQQGAAHPGRILGIHWAEPAHITRFMEVICGDHTRSANAQRALAWARSWGKEPTLVRRDVRGFIANRLFYAMLREAFHLVEAGYVTPAGVDRSIRNDLGYWTTLAGPFRLLDLTGIPAYAAVARGLFPELSCAKKIPRLLDRLARSGARGVANARGFYRYTPQQARRWEKVFEEFSYDIRALALKYPEDIGDRPRR